MRFRQHSIRLFGRRFTMASKIHSESSLPIEPPESYPKNLPFTCLSCDDPCSSLDPDLAASIDMTSNMVGSIKPYARHFLIGSPAPWPSQIEEIPGSIVSELKTAAKERLEGKTIISATDGLQGILEFPSRKMYTLSHASTTKTVEEIVSGSDGSLVSQKAHIFVCVHMNRDKRCGVLGPLIVEAFHSEISRLGMDESVAVYGVSHVGGHKYAGNVIVYHENTILSGQWYGRVKPAHVPQILKDHVLGGKIVQEIWRGSMASA